MSWLLSLNRFTTIFCCHSMWCTSCTQQFVPLPIDSFVMDTLFPLRSISKQHLLKSRRIPIPLNSIRIFRQHTYLLHFISRQMYFIRSEIFIEVLPVDNYQSSLRPTDVTYFNLLGPGNRTARCKDGKEWEAGGENVHDIIALLEEPG